MLIPLLVISIGLICAALFWIFKSCLFKPISIKITQPPFDRMTIVYKFQYGAYSKSADIFRDIYKYSSSHDKLDIYYDDPKVVPFERRRFAVGAIVDEAKDQELIKQMQKAGYKIFKLPKLDRSIYATFPFNSDFDIFIAIRRVPYRLGDYIQAYKLEAHPFLEIYKRPLIHYVVPLSDFAAYNVSEISNEQA